MNNEDKSNWPWRSRTPKWPAQTRQGQAWPRITVITPSFNQGKFIEETIRSVLQQGYPNLEYIVIDGGSTDNTVEIIRKYERALTYWVSEPDRGQSHALNKGLQQATGEIIGWINSDDMYTEHCFKKVIKAFEGSPDALVVHGDRILLDSDSRVSGWGSLPPFHPDITGFIVCSETAFWRRAAMAPAGFNEELRFAMDLEFFSRLYHAGRFIKLDTFLGYFRCYSDNKSSTLLDVRDIEAEREWKKIFGNAHEGWRNRPQRRAAASLRSFLLNPCRVAYPYLYRRFILHKRGM